MNYIISASGIAGEITKNNPRNNTINLVVQDAGKYTFKAVIDFSTIFTLVGCIGGLIVGGFLGCCYGVAGGALLPLGVGLTVGSALGVTAGIGLSLVDSFQAVSKNRNLLFNHHNCCDAVKSIVTAGTSLGISLFYTLQYLIQFLGYIILALTNLVQCKEQHFLDNCGYAADAFVKIFSNLTDAILHPIINLLMCKGDVDSDLGIERLPGIR